VRILFATHQAVGLRHGGVWTQMLQIKAALKELGVTVTLYEMWKEFVWNKAGEKTKQVYEHILRYT
jgi:hypothetical protein